MTTKAAPDSKNVSATARAPARVAPPSKRLQRTGEGAPASHVPPSVHAALDTPSRPLDPAARSEMQSQFGHDFGAVRIHDGPAAAESARSLSARAYTVGQDIVWGAGERAPESPEARGLLAHELAHSVQQSGLQRASYDSIAPERSSECQQLEREAERAASAVEQGQSAPPLSRASAPLVSRASPSTPATPPATGAPPPGQIEMTNDVTGLGTLTHKISPDGPIPPPSAKAKVRKFRVDKFYMPGSKGEGAEERYREYASAKQLRSIIGFNADKQPRAELWESRDRTDVLGESWLQQVDWPVEEKDARWQAITGDHRPFPQVAGDTAQIDHIVELQLGGTNNPSNLRPLDKGPNGESGRMIWLEVSALAKAVRDEPAFALNAVDQIELGFDSVITQGPVWPGTPAPPWNALKVHNKAMSERVAPAADANTKFIDLAAGANKDTFAVPADWDKSAKTVDLETFPFNKASAQMISSMLLKRLKRTSPTTLNAEAELDLRNRTRIPLGAKAAAGGTAPLFKLTGTKQQNTPYDLKLTSKPAIIEFDYPYLSKVRMREVFLNPSGDLDWKATVSPSVKFLPDLNVEYSLGVLRLVSGIEEDKLKAKKLLGFTATKAQVSLALAPEFDIKGELGFVMGDPASPLVQGNLVVTKDEIGPVGKGRIDLKLPKVKEAGSEITYKGGGGRDEWTLDLHVKSQDFSLPGGYSLSGQIDASIPSGSGLKFTGELTAALPGGNSAALGLERRGEKDWVLTGKGTFNIPKLKQVSARVTYHLATGRLKATVSTETGFTIPVVNLEGKLKELNIEISPEGELSAWGAGSLQVQRGKAKGSVDVALHRDGRFSGTGEVSYQLTDTLTVGGKVEFDEAKRPRMRVQGTLEIKRYKLFDGKSDEKSLVDLSATIPVPGLSVGTSGLVLRVGGGLKLGYRFGPGLVDLTFEANFNPLDEDTDLSLGVKGQASIGASAWVKASAFAEGALQGDAIIAKAGIAAGLEITGEVILDSRVFADLSATFKKRKLDASIVLGLEASLVLGLALTAYVRAYADSIIGWGTSERWDWVLAQRKFPTGLTFKLSAPFGYSTDGGLKLPTVEQVTFEKPKIDAKGLLEKLWSGEPSSKVPV